MKIPTIYISTNTYPENPAPCWRVIHHGSPVMADSFDADLAMKTYLNIHAPNPDGDLTIPVWDGDKGEFTTWAEIGGKK